MIELTGLRADVPIGVMAAYGVLRLSSMALPGARLSWRTVGGSWHAVLEAPTDREGLGDLLLSEARRHAATPIWVGHDQIKGVARDEFHDAAQQAIDSQERERVEWLAALANEMAIDEESKSVESTPFDMSVARQKFLADGVKLAQALARSDRRKNEKSPEQDMKEALLGPWTYTDDQHSLGWDPSTMKFGAFTYKAPTGMANTGVRAAVWLAYQSIPIFPVLAWGKDQRTRSFQQRKRQAVFCWPVWEPPITFVELKSLLALPGLISEDEMEDFAGRGVTAVYRSEKFKPNKYMVTFRPAELAFSARA